MQDENALACFLRGHQGGVGFTDHILSISYCPSCCHSHRPQDFSVVSQHVFGPMSSTLLPCIHLPACSQEFRLDPGADSFSSDMVKHYIPSISLGFLSEPSWATGLRLRRFSLAPPHLSHHLWLSSMQFHICGSKFITHSLKYIFY